jgi:hypothetical protein
VNRTNPVGKTHRPNDGGSKQIRNAGQFLRDYTAQHVVTTVICRVKKHYFSSKFSHIRAMFHLFL